MDVKIIQNEISNPGLKALAMEVLDTVKLVKTGKKGYRQGLVELQGYKQIIQIMALEAMRKRIPMIPN